MIRKLWAQSPELMVCAALMMLTFLAALVGIFLDPRIITGAPAWLKPAKFGISTAIYCVSMAWIFQYFTIWPRFKRIAGWTVAIVFAFEIAIIDVQAFRGVTSHFNNATPLDATLFAIMGALIGVLWLTNLGVAAGLFRQKFANRTWGWSLRLGMSITVIGAGMGGLMTAPTREQAQAMAEHRQVPIVGAHTVGATDGGPGLPGTGWSLHHGDLRIPHFFGLHAFQVLPFIGWLAVRGRRSPSLIFAAAAGYLGLIGILTWQALRGQSIREPDARTLIAFGIWAAATILAVVWTGRAKEQHDPGTAVLTV